MNGTDAQLHIPVLISIRPWWKLRTFQVADNPIFPFQQLVQPILTSTEDLLKLTKRLWSALDQMQHMRDRDTWKLPPL